MKIRIFLTAALFLSGIFFSIPEFNSTLIQFFALIFHRELNVQFWSYGLSHFGIELFVMGILLFLFLFKPERFLKPFGFMFAITVVILLFFIFLFQYAANIPITDDYRAVLNFFIEFVSVSNFSEKFSLLTSFYDDSRIVMLRTIALIFYFFSGVVNFKSLLIFSNIILLALLLLFYLTISAEKWRWHIILVISVLLFHFGYYDAVLWVIPSMHYKLVVVFLLLALFFIRKNSFQMQLLACLSAVLGIFTIGNGWLILPVVMLYFSLEKKWKHLIFWLFFTFMLLFIYYEKKPELIGENTTSALNYFIFSCCFLGSAFQFFYKLHLPFFFGIVIWILFIWLTFKKYHKQNFVVYGLILFVLLSSLLSAHFRLKNGDISVAISNRYAFYSLIAICGLLIALFEKTSEMTRKKIFQNALILSVVYHLLTGIFFFPEAPVRKQKLENFISDIKNEKPFREVEPIIPSGSDLTVKKAMEKKIYFP